MKGCLGFLAALFLVSLVLWLLVGIPPTVLIGREILEARAWLTWWTPVVLAVALYPMWMGALLWLGSRLQRIGGSWAVVGIVGPTAAIVLVAMIMPLTFAALGGTGDPLPVEVKKPCEDRQSDGNLTIIAWSPRCPHELGTAVRIRISVRNVTAEPLSFDTAGTPSSLLNPYIQALPYRGPRPAYDLEFYGEPTCHQEALMWLWSETLPEPLPPAFVLGPGEQRTLIDATWIPPEGVTLESGHFSFIFRDRSYGTRISLWPCGRR